MPSLLPTISQNMVLVAQTVQLDFGYIFGSDKCKATCERVIKYLRYSYENCSNRSFEEISRENTKTEEFCLQMPTREAYQSELKLAEYIALHSEGKVSDFEIKTVLDEFIASHTFVYEAGINEQGHLDIIRSCKVGNFDNWANYPLVYVSHLDFGFTCNEIQACLVSLFYSELTFRMVRL